MIFGPTALAQAEGAVLAHSMRIGNRVLRKGRALTAGDIDTLASAGHSTVVAARLEPGDWDEDRAAAALAAAIVGPDPAGRGLRLTPASTGRVNIMATGPGIARIDAEAVDRFNAIHPMITLATVPRWHRLGAGGMLATVKIIAYAVPQDAVRAATEAGAGALSLAPVRLGSARLIQTELPGVKPGRGAMAMQARLDALGMEMAHQIVPHDAGAIGAALGAATEDLLMILTASATSDAQDTAPEGLRAAGGAMVHFGMPVDPGNLLFVGRLGQRPVIGLPGCAKSPALNGADWVLERLACAVPVGPKDIQSMGVGGLLKDIPTRPLPRRRIGGGEAGSA